MTHVTKIAVTATMAVVSVNHHIIIDDSDKRNHKPKKLHTSKPDLCIRQNMADSDAVTRTVSQSAPLIMHPTSFGPIQTTYAPNESWPI